MRFALNHIATPSLTVADFFALARRLGLTEVEIQRHAERRRQRPGGGGEGRRRGGRRDAALDQRALSVQRLVGRPARPRRGAGRLRPGGGREGARHVPAQRRDAGRPRRPRGGAGGDGADPARARPDGPRRAARLPGLVAAHQGGGGGGDRRGPAGRTSTGWCTTPSTTPPRRRDGVFPPSAPASSTSRASPTPASPSPTCSIRTGCWSTPPTGSTTSDRSARSSGSATTVRSASEPFAAEVQGSPTRGGAAGEHGASPDPWRRLQRDDQDAGSHHHRPVVGRPLRRPDRRPAGGHGELLEKYIGGSPTNIACGTARLGLKSAVITGSATSTWGASSSSSWHGRATPVA